MIQPYLLEDVLSQYDGQLWKWLQVGFMPARVGAFAEMRWKRDGVELAAQYMPGGVKLEWYLRVTSPPSWWMRRSRYGTLEEMWGIYITYLLTGELDEE